MILRCINNFADFGSDDNVVTEVSYPMPLFELLKEVSDLEKEWFWVLVTGKPVSDWNHVPAISDEVIFLRRVGFSGAVGAALSYAAPYIIGALVSAVVGWYASSLYEPDGPDTGGNSQTYTWSGIKNIIGEGSVMPIVYGRHRVGGVVLEAHIDGAEGATAGEEQWLNVLLGLSEGEIQEVETDTIMLDNNMLSSYQDDKWFNEQIQIGGYSNTFGVYHQHDIHNPGTNELTFVIAWTYNTHTGMHHNFIVEYARIGTENWSTLKHWPVRISPDPNDLQYQPDYKTTTNEYTVQMSDVGFYHLDNFKFRITRLPLQGVYPGEQPERAMDIKCAIEKGAFRTVKYETRIGSVSQTPISNFSKIYRHYNMNQTVQLTHGNTYTYSTNAAVDMVKLNIQIPSLYELNDEGDMYPHNLDFNVRYKKRSDTTFIDAGNFNIEKKSKSELNLTIPIHFNERDNYDVRIERLSPDCNDLNTAGDSYLTSVTEVENGLVAYVNTASLGLRLLATDTLSGAMPTVSVIVKGKVLYDFRTQSYEWSANPALVVYDLLTNKRYGLGKKIDPAQIDMDLMIEFANWCDETITHINEDGTTQTQKRYEINVVLDKQYKAQELINKILATCRAEMYHVGSMLQVVVEKAMTQPVQVFNMGNIKPGSYEESFISLRDIPNQIKCQVWLEENNFKPEPIIAVDKSRLDEPVESRDLQMIGVTNLVQAKRELIFAMKKAKAIRRTVKFESLIEGTIVKPGCLIAFQHDQPQNGFGGRVKAVDGNTIILNRPVPVITGATYTFCVKRQSDQTYFVHEFTWLNSSVTQISEINCGATNPPTGVKYFDLWTYGHFDIEDGMPDVIKTTRPLRVRSVTKTSDHYYKIEAEEYTDQVFNADPNIDVYPRDWSMLDEVVEYEHDGQAPIDDGNKVTPGINTLIGYVQGIVLERLIRRQGAGLAYDLEVSYAKIRLPSTSPYVLSHYEILYTTEYNCTKDQWHLAGTTNTTTFVIQNVEVGQMYYVAIRAVTRSGLGNNILNSDQAFANSLLIEPKANPLPPTNLTVSGDVFQNIINWDNAERYEYVEIWASAGVNDRSLAVKAGTVAGDKYTHTGLNFNVTYFYWVIAYDFIGLASSWCPSSATEGVPGTPSSDPAIIKAMLDGEIEDSMLVQSLRDKLDSNGEVVSQVELLNNMWTVKINDDMHCAGVGLSMYEDWESDRAYVNGDYVHAPNERIYQCLVANTGIQPGAASNWTTYWDEIEGGAKSEFVVLADKFAIVREDGYGNLVKPFTVGTVNGVNNVVGIDGALVVDGSIAAQHVATGTLVIGNFSPETQGYVLNSNQQWEDIDGDGKPDNYADRTSEQIAGSGVNIALPRYSVFNSPNGLPPMNWGSSADRTVAQETSFGKIGDRCLKLTCIQNGPHYIYFCRFNSNQASIPIEPNKKWILSAWIRCSQVGFTGRFYMNTIVGSHNAIWAKNSPGINTWTRVSAVIDLTSDPSDGCLAFIHFENADGLTVHIDAFMMEEQVGELETPSAYAIPAAADITDYGYMGSLDADRTLAEIGGSGVNVVAPRYSVFNEDSGLPPIGTSGQCNFLQETSFGYFGNRCLGMYATGIDAHVSLGPTGSYNVNISPNKKWIISCYVHSSSTTGYVQFYYFTDAGNAYAENVLIDKAGQWTRLHAILDLTNDNSTRCRLRLDLQNSTGTTIYFDGLMMEEQIGELETPSAYSIPASANIGDYGYTGDMNATQNHIFAQASEPSSGMVLGDIWFDTDDDNHQYWYNGASWTSVRDVKISQAFIAAAEAESKADGKITSFYQASAPTSGMSDGDLWFDTNDGNKVYRFDSTGGSPVYNIVDEDGNTYSTGSWSRSSASDCYGSTSLYAIAGSDATYSWSAGNTGEVDFWVWWANSSGTRNTQAVYRCYDRGTLLNERVVNQRENGGAWYFLGTYEVKEYAKIQVVSVGSTSDGSTSADAAYFVTKEPGGWVEVQDVGIQNAIEDAATAQATADGKVLTFFTNYQTSVPTAEGVGDLWYCAENCVLSRWNGSAWNAVSTYGSDWEDVRGNNKPEDGATNDSNWRYSGNVTYMDGNKIWTGTVSLDKINGNHGTLTVNSGTVTFQDAGRIIVENGADLHFVSKSAYDSSKIVFNRGNAYSPMAEIYVDYNNASFHINPTQTNRSISIGLNPEWYNLSLNVSNVVSVGAAITHFYGHIIPYHDAYTPQFNCGSASRYWNYIFSNNVLQVCDFYWMDKRVEDGNVIEVDDVEVIKSIKPTEAVDPRTGLYMVNDSTIPKWLVHKHDKDGEEKDDDGNRIQTWKAGEVAVDHKGKPFMSTTTMLSLLMGAIRQLDERIERIEKAA